jgi:glutaredoxin
MSYVANTYLKQGCPHCFKFLLFMTEAKLLDRINIIEPDPESEEFEQIRTMLTEKLGKKATFPTVEVEEGKFMNESDDLIEYFAKANDIALDDMQVLPIYTQGLFTHVRKLFFANRAYREKYGEIEFKMP